MRASFEDALRELLNLYRNDTETPTTKAELIEALENVQSDLEEEDDDDNGEDEVA